MPDVHQALGPDRLEASAQTLDGVELRRTEAGTAHFPAGARTRAVLEAYEAAMGEGAPEDLGGQGGAGGVAVRIGLTVDVPGDGPHVGGDGLQPSGLAPIFFADGTGDEGEGFDGAKEGGAGGPPGRAVLGEATTGHKVMEVRGVLQVPAPRRQATRETREGGPDEPLVLGEPFAGER
jgi:hypothetical protein